MAISPLVAWIGMPAPGKPGETRYRGAQLRSKDGSTFNVGIGDYVHVESGSANPYIARVKELKEKGGKHLAVFQWLYQPSEVPKLKAADTFANEVFMNNHADENLLETIRETIRIAFKDPRNQQFTKSLLYADSSLQQILADPPKYICMRSYDHVAETVSPITLEIFQESCVFPNARHPRINDVPNSSSATVPTAHRAEGSSETAGNDSIGMRDMPSHPQNLSNLANHAMTCAGCNQSLCRKMKIVLQHIKGCSAGPTCRMCSQYMEIVTEHAKRCRLPARTCHVPHCHDKKPSTIVEHALECLSSNQPCQVGDCESAKKFVRYVWGCNDANCIVCQKFQALLQFHETGCENGCMFPDCPHFSDTLKHALQRCPRGPSTCVKCAVVGLLTEKHATRCRYPAQCRFPVHMAVGPNGEQRAFVFVGMGVPQQHQHLNMQMGYQMGQNNRLDSSVSSSDNPTLVANRMGPVAPVENDIPRAVAPSAQSNGSHHIQTPQPSATLPQQQLSVSSSALLPDMHGAAIRSAPPFQVAVMQVPLSTTSGPAAISTTPTKNEAAIPTITIAPGKTANASAPLLSSSSMLPPSAPLTTIATAKQAEISSSISSSTSVPPTTISATITPAKPMTTTFVSRPITDNKRIKHEAEEEEKLSATQKLTSLVRPMSLWDSSSEQTETKIPTRRSIFGSLRQQLGGKDCIRIGSDFQATLPEYSGTRPSTPTSTDICLWSPDAKITREDQFKERRKRKLELLSQRGTILNVVVSGGPRAGIWVRIVEPMKEGSTVLRVVPMQLTWPSSFGPADFVVSVSEVMFEVDAGNPDVRFPETLDEAILYDLYIQSKFEEGSEQLAKLREEVGSCLARGVPEIVSDWTRRSYIAYVHERFVSTDAKHLAEKTGKTASELNEFISCVSDKPLFIHRSSLPCSACRKTPSDRLVACVRFTICKTCFCVDCANQENAWRRKRVAKMNSDSLSASEQKLDTDESILSEDSKAFVCYMCDLAVRPYVKSPWTFRAIQNCGLDFNPELSWTVGRLEKRMNRIKIDQEFKKIPASDANNNKMMITTATVNAPSETSSVVSSNASAPATPVHSSHASLPLPTPSSVSSNQTQSVRVEPQQPTSLLQQQQQSASPIKQPQPPQPPGASQQQQSPVAKFEQQTTLADQAKTPEVVATSRTNAKSLPIFFDNESIIAAYDEKRLSALEAVNLIRNLLIEKSTKTLRSLVTANNATVQPL